MVIVEELLQALDVGLCWFLLSYYCRDSVKGLEEDEGRGLGPLFSPLFYLAVWVSLEGEMVNVLRVAEIDGECFL